MQPAPQTSSRNHGAPYVFTSRDKKSRRDVQAGIILFAGSDASGTPVGIRTPNLLIRSQTLYPIELRAL